MSRDTTGDWLGDSEPGGCECGSCGRIFIGSEHRSTCRLCADPGRTDCLPLPTDRNQGWPGVYAVLYTDSINGEQTCRDDLWMVTTSSLKDVIDRAQTAAYAEGRKDEAEARSKPLSDSDIEDAFYEAFPGHELHQESVDFARAVERRLLVKRPDCGDKDSTDGTFWMIERGSNQGQSPTCWWAGRLDHSRRAGRAVLLQAGHLQRDV